MPSFIGTEWLSSPGAEMTIRLEISRLKAICPDFGGRTGYSFSLTEEFGRPGRAMFSCRSRSILTALLAVLLQGGSASGTEATDAQAAVLQSGSLAQKIALLSAIEVCGALPPAYQAPVKALALDATQPDAVRILASVALCEVRDAYASILPLLARGWSEKTIAPSARWATLTVIKHIANRAIEMKATDFLPALKVTRERVAASPISGEVDKTEVSAAVEKVDASIRYLQSVSEAKFETFAVKLIGEHMVVFGVGAIYLVLLIAQVVLYIGNSRRIVLLDDTLQKLSVKLPDWAGGASISFRYLLCTPVLVGSARVLDRWVTTNLATACRNFERAALARHAAAPASLMIDGELLGPTPASIGGLLGSKMCRIMILGPLEPRVGLLDQVARWYLAGELSAKVAFPLWLDRTLLASCAGSCELLTKSGECISGPERDRH